MTSTTTIRTNEQINVEGLLPRLSFMSAHTFMGATLGGTVLLPLVNKGSEASVTSISSATLTGVAAGLPAPYQALFVNAVLGDVNARLTDAIAKELASDKAQAVVPDIPGLEVHIDKAVFAQDQGKLLVKTHVEGHATSEAVNGLLDYLKH